MDGVLRVVYEAACMQLLLDHVILRFHILRQKRLVLLVKQAKQQCP